MSHADGKIPPRPVPAAFTHRETRLEPGGALAYEEGDWADALVVVERGELEIECRAGGVRHFASGALLWLSGLPLATFRNPGSEPLVLSAISRRSPIDVEPSPQEESKLP